MIDHVVLGCSLQEIFKRLVVAHKLDLAACNENLVKQNCSIDCVSLFGERGPFALCFGKGFREVANQGVVLQKNGCHVVLGGIGVEDEWLVRIEKP